jgi:tRNA (guanosine-2'-O-)-methyltransferase
MSTLHSKTGVRKLHKAAREEFGPRRDLCFLLQDWDDGYNVGGLFRVADGCGASELVMTGKTPVPPDNPMIGVTSLGQHRRIPFRHFVHHEDACLKLKEEGWTLVAVEIAEGAQSYQSFEFPARTCLVLGNEGAGVYGKVMKHVDHCVYIPMLGKGRSLNVTVSAAIVAFEAILRA